MYPVKLRIKNVAVLAGASETVVQSYVDMGFTDAQEDDPRQRRGALRTFSPLNVVQILLVRRLLEHGFSLKEARLIFDALRERKRHLWLDPERPWWRKKPPNEKRKPFVRLIVANLESGTPSVMLIRRSNFQYRLDRFGGIRIVPVQDILERVDAL